MEDSWGRSKGRWFVAWDFGGVAYWGLVWVLSPTAGDPIRAMQRGLHLRAPEFELEGLVWVVELWRALAVGDITPGSLISTSPNTSAHEMQSLHIHKCLAANMSHGDNSLYPAQ